MYNTMIPKIFNVKHKVVDTHTKEYTDSINYNGKPKYCPPLVKEWFNGIYSYDKNTVKVLPSLDKNIIRLIKSYFSLYSLKLIKKTRSKRFRARGKRSSTNRLLVGKPDLKHMNDKIIITAYVYNRRKKYYINKIKKTTTLDRVKKNKFINSIENLSRKSLELESIIEKYANLLLKKAIVSKHVSLIKYFSKNYLNSYIKKFMRKEIITLRHKQLISFEESKFEKQYLLPLINLIKLSYNKEITFNIINLKYFYNSSSIFSEALVTKLKNRKNKPIKVLGASLTRFNLPPKDRLSIYNEMYNKKRFMQNLNVKDLVLSNQDATINLLKNEDGLDKSLLKIGYDGNTPKTGTSTANLNKIIKSLKHKFTSGIRIEIAGRLTKRYTAERSIFKLRYKGNIKNPDSSYKGLSAVLLRGHAKSNLLYNHLRSKLRIGAFGLKTWISGG